MSSNHFTLEDLQHACRQARIVDIRQDQAVQDSLQRTHKLPPCPFNKGVGPTWACGAVGWRRRTVRRRRRTVRWRCRTVRRRRRTVCCSPRQLNLVTHICRLYGKLASAHQHIALLLMHVHYCLGHAASQPSWHHIKAKPCAGLTRTGRAVRRRCRAVPCVQQTLFRQVTIRCTMATMHSQSGISSTSCKRTARPQAHLHDLQACNRSMVQELF